MDESAISLLKPLAKVATKLTARKVSEGEVIPLTSSHFGGEPYAEIGERWPSCPVCNIDLTFICQIDVASGFHEKPEGIDLFTFFYCWECSPWGMEDETEGTWVVRTYADPKETFAKPIRPIGPEPYPPDVCLLVPEKVNSFPDWADLDFRHEKIIERFAHLDEPYEDYAAAVKSSGGETEICTLVGGYAHWIQREDIPLCNQCQHEMDLLTQIDSETDADVMWGDAGSLYLFYCATHPREIGLKLQCF